jgi:hypothetical protein
LTGAKEYDKMSHIRTYSFEQTNKKERTMATLPPQELLNLWKLEQLPLEMGMGHVLQNLVKLSSELEVHTSTLYQLRADVDRLIAHTRLPSSVKGKNKRSKPAD